MRSVGWVLLLAALAGCDRSPATREAAFTSDQHRLVLRVEVADTPSEREQGLMDRRSIPRGTGMLFDYLGVASTGGYWMKRTLVPLDIAFIRSGRVTEIDPMTPCVADPCPLTVPAEAYDLVVEAPAGTFASAGIVAGASFSLP